MQEVVALGNSDQRAGEDAFDAVIWKHLAHSVKNALRAKVLAWTGGRFSRAPAVAGIVAPYYRRLNRYAAAFSLISELTLLTLGGSLKRKEMLSARLGDVLAELYLLSAMLKRWQDEGQHESDLPLVKWCAEHGFATIEKRFDDVLLNFPLRSVAFVLRAMLLPPGMRAKPPSDAATAACANILLEPSESRDRLVGAVWTSCNKPSVELLEQAFELTVAVQPLLDRLKHSGVKDWRVAHAKGAITDAQAQALQAAQAATDAVINVDDFAPEAFAR
jgi:acyl-CoA dehydrogenase